MRVGLIAPPWIPVPPPSYGGTEVVVDTLARGLIAAGHDVLLVTTGDSTCPVPRRWVYERARIDDLLSLVVELRHVLYAYDVLARSGVDVVHDHTVSGPLYAGRYRDLPVVTTNHGPFTDDTKPLYREMASRVAIIAISHHHASTAGTIPIARIIHHGIDETQYRVGPGDGGYLLFLGRMSPTKGVAEAIAVARRAGMPLVIAAKMREAAERQYFDAEIAPLLGGGVEFAGEVGGTEKLDLLARAAALVNPLSWDEPFGLCMIEALACGTPVLTTARGAAPEIVDHGLTGFVCSGIDTMADAVGRVAAIDRHACRAAVESRFSARRMVADHVALYATVIASRRDRRRMAS